MNQAELEAKYIADMHAFYIANIEEVLKESEELPPLPVMNLTGSPHMNKFFSMTISCSQGYLDPAVYKRYYLKELHRFFSCYNKFMDYYEPNLLSSDIRPFADMIWQSFSTQERALSYIVEYFNTLNSAFLANALVTGTYAINSIYNSWISFSTRSLPSLQKLCPQCGYKLGFIDMDCPSCGEEVVITNEEAALEFTAIRMYVQSTGLFESSPFPGCITEVYDYHEMYTSGQIRLEHFVEHIDWVNTQYMRACRILERQSASADLDDNTLQHFFMIINGSIDIMNVLEKMRDNLVYSDGKKINLYWPVLLKSLKLIYRGYDVDQRHQNLPKRNTDDMQTEQ